MVYLLWGAIGLALAVLVAEVVLRLVVGLGDPPLYRADPSIEYLNVPGSYRRFGKRITINRWSMRAPELDPDKPAEEYRVLVVGDSIVHGGAKLDDGELATTLLRERLSRAMGRPVSVAAVATGSWGPPNQLAYLERYGLFGADAAIIVWSSHDAWDNPRFGPLPDALPQRRPLLALEEALRRYAPAMLARLTRRAGTPDFLWVGTERDVEASLSAARSMVSRFRSAGIPVGVVLHAARSERARDYDGPLRMGRGHLDRLVADLGLPIAETAGVFSALERTGIDPLMDDLHPNAAGQRALAEVMVELLGRLDPRAAASAGAG
ncbi:hypothetical protein J4558_04070 [Leptolyngbya sp. 15MV]|nr:hypothetical protein J4558_04070 [Leptolyngbya sp. 15MV]